jgi:tRNA-2-methylthio-N6-dimethylallyladenosine synthase
MNVAESAALRQILLARGWTELPPETSFNDSKQSAESDTLPNLVIINTCSVRITAEQRVIGRLGFYAALKNKLNTADPQNGNFKDMPRKKLFVLVTGCMAERIGESLIEKGADYILGTQNRNLFQSILDEVESAIDKKKKLPPQGFSFFQNYFTEGTFRSFVPIMHGCNNFCSYCIVPYVRGREISRSVSDILTEIDMLSLNNVKEITLLGQNVNSYLWHDDHKINFADLLELIAEHIAGTSIKWVRFLSSHPKDLSIQTINVIAKYPVYCRHIHLCVQHGSNKILKAMNRSYTREQYLDLVLRIKDTMPNVSLSTDILVGFPGETEDDVAEILSLMEQVRFLYSFMYHYNPREGTAAFDLPNRIDHKIKIERLNQVIKLQHKHTQEYLKNRIGKTEKVLVEYVSRNDKNELSCRSEFDEPIIIQGAHAELCGSFADVKIESLKGNTLKGSLVTL